MNIKIDKEACICCGTCYNSFDLIFDCDDEGKAILKKEPSNEEETEQAVQGMSYCPVEAISIEATDEPHGCCGGCSCSNGCGGCQ